MNDDPVDEIVHQWRRERPDLDPDPLLVFGRIEYLANAIDSVLRPPFAEAGLGNGDFNLLSALRRAGEPFRLSPGELSRDMLVTTGAVTKRVDRLEARGLVDRQTSDHDARGRAITLTPAGRKLVDELIEVHLANERALLADLSPIETTLLAELLKRLGTGL